MYDTTSPETARRETGVSAVGKWGIVNATLQFPTHTA